MAKKADVVFSGGQDSTTCLYWALEQGMDVRALTFDYGQRHHREVEAAAGIANLAGVEHEIISMGPILKGTSPLVSLSNLEQYADHKSLPGGLEKTFVPMRNQLFLTVAANRAFCRGANTLVTGVCEEDYGGYPDCRADFIYAIQEATRIGTFTLEAGFEGGFQIYTPLMNLTKKQTVELALCLPGCYAALAFSHTAYDGQYPPIGHDHATLLRQKGFEEANIPDPLVLRAMKAGLMDTPSAPNYEQHLVEYYTVLAKL
jgi:7-cyano-7-deazaguanine synthase